MTSLDPALVSADIKANEELVAFTRVLDADDPIFDPRTRPPLADAIDMIVGEQQGYAIPYASISLARHAGLEGQGLFRCLFGRDSLLIADLLRTRRPVLRSSVLCALGSVQGTGFDAVSEEEPGRIPHEVREVDDPLKRHLEEDGGWRFPYYGAVDATPIWLRVLAEVADEEPGLLEFPVAGRTLGQRAVSATDWLLRRLGTPSGLVESTRANPRGIENQVWKDSGDSYMHADGSLARGDSTASIETVAEAFDALLAAARLQALAPTLDWSMGAAELRQRAESLRERLLELLWLGDRFALGTERDDAGRQLPFDSQASNQGRLLDSAILMGPEFATYASAVADALVDPGLLGETGLRTLSARHLSYRPGGYHTGSAWPMDGAFAARGLIRHGRMREASMIADRTRRAIEGIGAYPEFFRGDYPAQGLISTAVADVVQHQFGGRRNRIMQPPQIIQGWTIGAYAWFTDARIEGDA